MTNKAPEVNQGKTETNTEKTRFVGKTWQDLLTIFFLEDISFIEEIGAETRSDGFTLPERTRVSFYGGGSVTLLRHSGNNLVNDLDVLRYQKKQAETD